MLRIELLKIKKDDYSFLNIETNNYDASLLRVSKGFNYFFIEVLFFFRYSIKYTNKKKE